MVASGTAALIQHQYLQPTDEGRESRMEQRRNLALLQTKLKLQRLHLMSLQGQHVAQLRLGRIFTFIEHLVLIKQCSGWKVEFHCTGSST